MLWYLNGAWDEASAVSNVRAVTENMAAVLRSLMRGLLLRGLLQQGGPLQISQMMM